MTFDAYGHLSEQKMQDLAEGLDRTFRESTPEVRAHARRPLDGLGVSEATGERERNRLLTCANAWRARRDSNPRPSD